MTKLFVLAALLAATAPATAPAQEASVRVGYSDLDLSTSAGVERLDNRIGSAIKVVCGDLVGQKPLSTMLAIHRCSRLTRGDVEGPRQVAIERARGKSPSVQVASTGGFAVTARHR